MTGFPDPLGVLLTPDELDRHLAGTASVTDRSRLSALCVEHPALSVQLQELRAAIVAEAEWDAMPSAAEAWAHVRQKNTPLNKKPKLSRVATMVVIGTLGVLLIVVGIPRIPSNASVSPHVVTTQAGQRRVVTLRDGSRITLGPQSRLMLNSSFGEADRDVGLAGEAYFEVRMMNRAPFVVHTSTITTRVLGTSFLVRRYENDAVTQIVVTSGKVVARGGASRVTLHQGDIGRVTDSSATVISGAADIDHVTAWRQGRLIFTETPIHEALSTLGHWYGYEFRLGDSALAKQVLTSEFRTDAFDETLWILTRALNATAQRTGNVIILRTQKQVPQTHDQVRHLLALPLEAGK